MTEFPRCDTERNFSDMSLTREEQFDYKKKIAESVFDFTNQLDTNTQGYYVCGSVNNSYNFTRNSDVDMLFVSDVDMDSQNLNKIDDYYFSLHAKLGLKPDEVWKYERCKVKDIEKYIKVVQDNKPSWHGYDCNSIDLYDAFVRLVMFTDGKTVRNSDTLCDLRSEAKKALRGWSVKFADELVGNHDLGYINSMLSTDFANSSEVVRFVTKNTVSNIFKVMQKVQQSSQLH